MFFQSFMFPGLESQRSGEALFVAFCFFRVLCYMAGRANFLGYNVIVSMFMLLCLRVFYSAVLV